MAKALRPDRSNVNPNGGAIALGHPIGATGAVLTLGALVTPPALISLLGHAGYRAKRLSDETPFPDRRLAEPDLASSCPSHTDIPDPP